MREVDSSLGPRSHLNPSFSIKLHLPPLKLFFSTTVTSKPAFANRAAVASPPTPAPGRDDDSQIFSWWQILPTNEARETDQWWLPSFCHLAGVTFLLASWQICVFSAILQWATQQSPWYCAMILGPGGCWYPVRTYLWRIFEWVDGSTTDTYAYGSMRTNVLCH
jgi:hypothetical protein